MQAVKVHQPDLLARVMVHLLLHLVDSMIDFGPSSAFNTERCSKYHNINLISLTNIVTLMTVLIVILYVSLIIIITLHAGVKHLTPLFEVETSTLINLLQAEI